MTQAGVCTVFIETSASNTLAKTVSAELTYCDTVQVLSLHTGSLGTGDAATFIGMYRANVETIMEGLKDEG
jgi:ABC-type Zn uptake system ZnuABC Zn-binding protein ZnuA